VKPLKVALLTTDNRDLYRAPSQPAPEFGTAPTALLQGFALLPEVEVHVVSCVRQPLSSPARLAPNVAYHSVVVPKLGWMKTLFQGCIRATRKKLRELQPDIVHGQGTEQDCAMTAVFSNFPNVLTIHGNMKAVAAFDRARMGSYYWLVAGLESYALRRTRGVFCNSAHTERLVSPRTGRTWRVPNALRLDFFSPGPPPPATDLPVLLNVGTIVPYKRQVELLGVAGRLHARGCRFELQFAGMLEEHTAYGAAFRRELARGEAAGYARYLGSLTTGQLVAAMDAARALAHWPSEEAFGLVVAEALARNLKFFGAATGGVVDIVEHVEGAELFAPNDYSGLEESLVRWLKAGAPKPQTAAPVIRQRYHPEVVARRHLEIYREVLGGCVTRSSSAEAAQDRDAA
jgi:glycosyltransferase involved in cell wall biosynthesis